MNAVKLLALDLDGTLLNSQKELTPRTCDALYTAAEACLLYTSPSPRDRTRSRMPSSA